MLSRLKKRAETVRVYSFMRSLISFLKAKTLDFLAFRAFRRLCHLKEREKGAPLTLLSAVSFLKGDAQRPKRKKGRAPRRTRAPSAAAACASGLTCGWASASCQ